MKRNIHIWVITCLIIAITEIGYADRTYYLDTTSGCTQSVISLSHGQKATVKDASVGTLGSGQGRGTCSITFQSPGGFEVDFDEGRITDCGITFSIHAGSSTSYPVDQSYTCGSSFVRRDQYLGYTYITVSLSKTDPSSTGYKVEVDITGRSASFTNSGFTYGYGNLTAGILASIIISAIVSLLCCILIPVCIYCCLKKRRRRQSDIPVVYTAPVHGYNNTATYGRPVYIKS